jgi:predicted nucleotidyltransferase
VRTVTTAIDIDLARVAELCRRRGIRELALFGSVLRDDFRPDSDVDVLVVFDDNARISLLDIAAIRDELAFIVGRDVDLVEKASLRNPFRRREILRTAETVYAA